MAEVVRLPHFVMVVVVVVDRNCTWVVAEGGFKTSSLSAVGEDIDGWLFVHALS